MGGPEFWNWAVAALALTCNFLFSGVIFGWASLQLLLEDEGLYRSLCPALEPNCHDRMSRLLFLYAVGSTANVVGATPCGFLVDHVGPLVCNILCGVIMSAGFFLVGISEEDSFDAFAVGAVLIGVGGSLEMMTSMPVAFIIPEAHRASVLSGFNCLFDASSVIFLGFYQLYRAGISRRTILVSYSVLCAVLHIALVIAWWCGPSALLRRVKVAELEEGKSGGSEEGSLENVQALEEAKESELSAVEVAGQTEAGSMPNSTEGIPSGQLLQKLPLHGLPLKQQLCTFEFLFVCVFLPLQLFRSNTYLGTNKQLLEELGDDANDYAYTQIFVASLPASTAFLPLISIVLKRYGFANAFMLIVVLGVLWNSIALVESLPMQLLSFAFFTNFRAFLYSFEFVYVTHTFGSRTSASVNGLIYGFAGVLNFLIWPCTSLTKHFAQGDESGLSYLYVGLLVLCLPPFVMVLLLRRRLLAQPVSDIRKPISKALVSKSGQSPLESDSVADVEKVPNSGDRKWDEASI